MTQPIRILDKTSGKEYDADSIGSLLQLWKTFEHDENVDYDASSPEWIHLMRDNGEWVLNAGEDTFPFESISLPASRFSILFPEQPNILEATGQ